MDKYVIDGHLAIDFGIRTGIRLISPDCPDLPAPARYLLANQIAAIDGVSCAVAYQQLEEQLNSGCISSQQLGEERQPPLQT